LVTASFECGALSLSGACIVNIVIFALRPVNLRSSVVRIQRLRLLADAH